MKKVILTGVQPSGRLHIGNYLGTMRNWRNYIGEYSCYFFIADWHSLTENYDPKEKKKQIFELAVDMLSIGADPGKCVIFRQSDLPEHTELTWYFNCITPISFLERMTQLKDKAGVSTIIKRVIEQKDEDVKKDIEEKIKKFNLKQLGVDAETLKSFINEILVPSTMQKVIHKIEGARGESNFGLFDYPVLMASDILMYDTDLVPVGIDQVQHIELAREIARFFNNRFGETFKSPEPLLTEIPKVMSLTHPDKKMSKSDGEKSCIFLSDEPEVIMEKIKKATADEAGLPNLYQLGEMFISDFNKVSYKNNNLKLKTELAEAISDHFADFRKKRKEWLKKEKEVQKILDDGAKRARKVASKKMIEVRKRVGLR